MAFTSENKVHYAKLPGQLLKLCKIVPFLYAIYRRRIGASAAVAWRAVNSEFIEYCLRSQ